MNYKEKERNRVTALLENFFNDAGQGIYYGEKRDFVLQDSSLNLMEEIREDTIEYFNKNSISWHKGKKNLPTGHLLSSQVACVNHLFFLRERKDLADLVLRGLRDDIIEAVIIDDGYVEFEFIGKENYLGESSFTRGANTTSIDAMMLGRKANGKNIVIFIEWKYTENYRSDNKYKETRANIYDKLIMNPNSPFQIEDPRYLYYEPFYQLMRQTLLAWKIVDNNDYNSDEYIHILVVPEKNIELRDRITSPDLKGDNLEEAWKSVLKRPRNFKIFSPKELLKPLLNNEEAEPYIDYLKARY